MKGRKKENIETKFCVECKKDKRLTSFYNSNNSMFDGKSPICKPCLWKMVDIDDMGTVYNTLKLLDIPFIQEYWDAALEGKGNVFGNYIKMANSLHQFKGLTWKDSDLNKAGDDAVEGIGPIENSQESVEITEQLINKWGHGYQPEEYIQFERKYNSLKNHYPEKTAMHTEALFTYIRYRVKEEMATAKGTAKEAKDWGQLAKDAANAAKINPSQLTKADLSDGLDSFSQLTRSVEQAVDVIDILPRFKERPQDKVDITLWLYVNYVRDLKGLPPASYADIYKFYEDRVKEYEVGFGGEQDGLL